MTKWSFTRMNENCQIHISCILLMTAITMLEVSQYRCAKYLFLGKTTNKQYSHKEVLLQIFPQRSFYLWIVLSWFIFILHKPGETCNSDTTPAVCQHLPLHHAKKKAWAQFPWNIFVCCLICFSSPDINICFFIVFKHSQLLTAVYSFHSSANENTECRHFKPLRWFILL